MVAIRRLLIANRGEIAARIIRTCRAMGISTALATSRVDARSVAADLADLVIEVESTGPRQAYLSLSGMIAAALEVGAQAIHPGYGFLAEDASFAQACAEAGLIFVGPGPGAMRTMGSKIAAKEAATAAGLTVLPGFSGSQQTEVLEAEALKIGLPVLIKASAGGGGKGMRIVRQPGEISEAIAAARREAAASFGDDALLLERVIEPARHVEVQILADRHGHVVHLGERECSMQRRHQKIIEETPSMALTAPRREQMCQAAVRLAASIGYVGAGTVEFIVDGDSGEFFFLEVNARLQVEHGVTELVTGLDLVREQIRVARGEPLGYVQDDVTFRGAAVECRVYAEDPRAAFMPQPGRLLDWHLPDGHDVRIDAGVRAGDEVTVHYDPLLAKVMAHGVDRDAACDKLSLALADLCVLGVTTNAALLISLLNHPSHRRGDLTTTFVAEHLAELHRPESDEVWQRAAIAVALVGLEERRQARRILPGLPRAFSNNPRPAEPVSYRLSDGRTLTVGVDGVGENLVVEIAGVRRSVELLSWDGAAVRMRIERLQLQARVVRSDSTTIWVHMGGHTLRLRELPRFAEAGEHEQSLSCVAPMPGRIVEVRVAEGDAVTPDSVVAVIEAMKMEHTVRSGLSGLVERLLVREGQQVAGGAKLAILVADDGAD